MCCGCGGDGNNMKATRLTETLVSSSSTHTRSMNTHTEQTKPINSEMNRGRVKTEGKTSNGRMVELSL